MDENQNEETETYPKATAYVTLFSTALAVGACIGVGIVAGGEVTLAAKAKFQELRAARATKKAAKTED